MKATQWDDLGFGWSLRCWQKRAIQKLMKQVEDGFLSANCYEKERYCSKSVGWLLFTYGKSGFEFAIRFILSATAPHERD